MLLYLALKKEKKKKETNTNRHEREQQKRKIPAVWRPLSKPHIRQQEHVYIEETTSSLVMSKGYLWGVSSPGEWLNTEASFPINTLLYLSLPCRSTGFSSSNPNCYINMSFVTTQFHFVLWYGKRFGWVEKESNNCYMLFLLHFGKYRIFTCAVTMILQGLCEHVNNIPLVQRFLSTS